jgi:hypothetical protein
MTRDDSSESRGVGRIIEELTREGDVVGYDVARRIPDDNGIPCCI